MSDTEQQSVSSAARDLAIKVRRDVAEAVGGGYYSDGAATTVPVGARAFVQLTELVVKLADRVEALEADLT